jgi:acetoin utilization protein AcuB
MRVDRVMSRNVVTIGADETCDQALSEMLRWKVRHLPVLDAGGSLRGVLTDRDLRHQLLAPGVLERIPHTSTRLLLKERPVREAMSAPAICLGALAEIEEAAGIMRQNRIGSLPVVDGGKVVGIVTETDLLRHLVRAEEAAGPELDIIVSYP